MRIMKKIRAFIHNERGDTLIEALAAILIAVLGAVTLSTMVVASVNISASSQAALSQIYQAEQNMKPINSIRDTVNVTLGNVSKEFSIQLYQSQDGTFIRYENQQGNLTKEEA